MSNPATPKDILDWIYKEVVGLCEATEDDATLASILRSNPSNSYQAAYARGRISEAKGIRRTIAEVINQKRQELAKDTTAFTTEAKLRRLAALAINKIRGEPIFFERAGLTGESLFKTAVENNLFTFDEFHHAPACPANHYHHTRLPTGRCACGAASVAKEETS